MDNEIPVGKDPQEPSLTDAQLYQISVINQVAYNAVCRTLENILDDTPKWDMEWIGELSDAIADICERYFDIPECLSYPYIDEG